MSNDTGNSFWFYWLDPIPAGNGVENIRDALVNESTQPQYYKANAIDLLEIE
jgi:ABC-type Zn uptake system ZnuABC Zn-binding protein ZnuA